MRTCPPFCTQEDTRAIRQMAGCMLMSDVFCLHALNLHDAQKSSVMDKQDQ